MTEIIEYAAFLMASAGAAAMVKVLVSRTDALRDTWINRKPLSCPLCMGFWVGCVLSFFLHGGENGWFWIVYEGLQASAFSWFFYSKITGDE